MKKILVAGFLAISTVTTSFAVRQSEDLDTIINVNLAKGSKDTRSVKLLQHFLIGLSCLDPRLVQGKNASSFGLFGGKTFDAVTMFQKANGVVPANGSVLGSTREIINDKVADTECKGVPGTKNARSSQTVVLPTSSQVAAVPKPTTVTPLSSAPSLAMSTGDNSPIIFGAENKIAEFAVSTNSQGRVSLSSLVLTTTFFGFTGQLSSLRLADGDGTVRGALVRSQGDGLVTVTFTSPYQLSPSTSKIFSVYSTITKLSDTSGGALLTSKFVSPATFFWKDEISGITKTGGDLATFPSMLYTTGNASSVASGPNTYPTIAVTAAGLTAPFYANQIINIVLTKDAAAKDTDTVQLRLKKTTGQLRLQNNQWTGTLGRDIGLVAGESYTLQARTCDIASTCNAWVDIYSSVVQ
jgi:hypothetical protein